jgi:hypothetical protein
VLASTSPVLRLEACPSTLDNFFSCDARALCMLGKSSISEPPSLYPFNFSLISCIVIPNSLFFCIFLEFIFFFKSSFFFFFGSTRTLNSGSHTC